MEVLFLRTAYSIRCSIYTSLHRRNVMTIAFAISFVIAFLFSFHWNRRRTNDVSAFLCAAPKVNEANENVTLIVYGLLSDYFVMKIKLRGDHDHVLHYEFDIGLVRSSLRLSYRSGHSRKTSKWVKLRNEEIYYNVAKIQWQICGWTMIQLKSWLFFGRISLTLNKK